jgi:hypothetical protein
MAGLIAEFAAAAFGLGRAAVPPPAEGGPDLRVDEYTPYTTPSRTADTKHKTSRVIM